ncbi:MAG: outer membrane beta-barrel protein [Micropepsaceae bacterium]
MRIRTLLAATTAVALVAAAPGAEASNLYVSVFGGANWLADDSGVTTEETTSGHWSQSADTGFVLGGAVGTHLDRWVNGLSVEMEVSYRRNDLGGHWSEPEEDEFGILTGNMSTFAIMANAWYEFDIGSKARPYFGGGVGWSRMNADMVAVSTSDGIATSTDTNDSFENSGFAYQLGAGFHYEVSPGVDVGLGYRFFDGPNFQEFFESEDGSLVNQSHAVLVDLKIDIN